VGQFLKALATTLALNAGIKTLGTGLGRHRFKS